MTRTLASFCGELTSADSKTLLEFDLEVPEGTRALEARFDYRPAFSEDAERNRVQVEQAVKEYLGDVARDDPELLARMLGRKEFSQNIHRLRNLLNWNIYDPRGRFRGRWDWREDGRSETSWIGEKNSAPGFLDGPTSAGRWCLVLEVFQICTERCSYELTVQAHQLTEAPATGIGKSGPREAPKRGKARHPERSNQGPGPLVIPRPGWLRGEMHAHSAHSDGKYNVSELAQRAEAAGLDFVALTDHNTTSGHEEATATSDVLFLRGEELTTFYGHFCLYEAPKHVEWHRRGKRLSIETIADTVRPGGVMLSLAHPFKIGDPICVGCRWPGDDPPPDRFDLLEVWPGWWGDRSVEIRRAVALWDRLWDQGCRPVVIAGKDWHGPLQEDGPGRRFARTVVAAATSTREEILKGLRAGAVYLTVGPHIDLRLEHNGETAKLGEVVHLEPNQEAGLHATLDGPVPAGSVLGFVRDGKVENTREVSAVEAHRGTAHYEIPVQRPGRYRVELWGPDGELILLANHIEVTQ